MSAPRLLIFDADGTLRRTTVAGQPCPHAEREWELLPGVAEVLRRLDWGPRGTMLGVATNQDHVGYGLLGDELARRLVRDMVVAACGQLPARHSLQICPHAIEAGCECRKPRPGMLLRILDELGAAPGESLFVGDHEVDEGAARAAGVPFRWSWEFFRAPPTTPRTRARPRGSRAIRARSRS
ncbi:MAG: HAD-IIIA family hydrolase [Acidobacteria bacterium]|nr:HAD-IIIA family hydrolase [Acidobacteriota bacterium]